MSSRRSVIASVVAALVAVFMLALPGRASADPDGDPKFGALVVSVCTEDGRPVPGAHVDIRHGDKIVARGTTNQQGKFVVRPIHAGKFGVFAERRPVGAGRELALVKPQTKNEVKVVLKKK